MGIENKAAMWYNPVGYRKAYTCSRLYEILFPVGAGRGIF